MWNPFKRKTTDPAACQIIKRIRELLGPNGEHWIKGRFRDGAGNYCVMGAYQQARNEVIRDIHSDDYDYIISPVKVHKAIAKAAPCEEGYLTVWNDKEGTTWPDIDRALAYAENSICGEDGKK